MPEAAASGLPRIKDALDAIGMAAEESEHKMAALAVAAAADRARKEADPRRGPNGEFYEDLTPNGRAEYDMTHGHASDVPVSELAAAPGMNPFSTDVLDAQGFTRGSYRSGGSNVTAYDMKVARDFEDFADRLFAASGDPNNFIATAYKTLAGFIKEGRMGGTTANQYAQAILFNFAGGAFQEAADPTASPQMRALDAEFLRFLSSGMLNGSGRA